jgi:predicted metal-binding membrane protein
LRGITNHPRRLIWAAVLLAASITWWSLHLVDSTASSWVVLIEELCRIGKPSFGSVRVAAAYALWATMSLTMMLPSALPMISTYLDISDAARERAQTVAPAGYLVLGYAAVWLAFAAVATALQSVAELTPTLSLGDRRYAAGVLLLAGFYQFAPIKHACLSKCRAPMPYFLANWSDRASRVLRMGLEQGALCLACCWALMLLMFAAGLMNALWMAGLAVLVALEKTLRWPEPAVYGSGAGLILAGLILLLES